MYVYVILLVFFVYFIVCVCSVGVIIKCSCGVFFNFLFYEDFKWGGCGDDLKYGLYFSE